MNTSTRIKVFRGINDATESKVNNWLVANEDVDIIKIDVTSVAEEKDGSLHRDLQYTIIYKE